MTAGIGTMMIMKMILIITSICDYKQCPNQYWPADLILVSNVCHKHRHKTHRDWVTV